MEDAVLVRSMSTLTKLALLPVLALGLAALYLVLRYDDAEDAPAKARKVGAV